MSTPICDQVKLLNKTADEFERFWVKYFEAISDSRCDKHHAGFNDDSRFTVFKVPLYFSSCIGYYGSSSCSTFGNFNAELASKYMVMAINAMRDRLFAKCAQLIREDADKLVADARKELAELSKQLDLCCAPQMEAIK